jgi:dTDP-4-amino-4,6-dideoxygalactose transaminase
MVLTNDEDIYNKIKLMRDHGRGKDGSVSIWGFNSRLDNLQAAILNFFFRAMMKQLIEEEILLTYIIKN